MVDADALRILPGVLREPGVADYEDAVEGGLVHPLLVASLDVVPFRLGRRARWGG